VKQTVIDAGNRNAVASIVPVETIDESSLADLPTLLHFVDQRLKEAEIWKNAGPVHAFNRKVKIETLIIEMCYHKDGIRLRDLVSEIKRTPQFRKAKDTKREVIKLLKALTKIGVVEKIKDRGETLYKITIPVYAPEIAVPDGDSRYAEPLVVKIAAKVYKEAVASRLILLAYKKRSLVHSIISDLAALRKAIEDVKTVMREEDFYLIFEMNQNIENLGTMYVTYAESGTLPDNEPVEFHRLEEKMDRLRSLLDWRDR
jgi:hypothetical protein